MVRGLRSGGRRRAGRAHVGDRPPTGRDRGPPPAAGRAAGRAAAAARSASGGSAALRAGRTAGHVGRATDPAAVASRPGWPPLASPATTPCGCSRRRRSRPSPTGDRPTAAACRAWMVIYLNMMSGIIAALPSAEDGARWLAQARADARWRADRRSRRRRGHRLRAARVRPAQSRARDPRGRRRPPAWRTVGRERCARPAGLDSPRAPRPGWSHRAAPTPRRSPRRTAPGRVHRVPVQRLPADGVRSASRGRRSGGRPGATPTDSPGWPAIASRLTSPPRAGSRSTHWPVTSPPPPSGASMFLVAWERAGRPVARTLNVTCYALAMVHGVLGDDRRRDQWIDITRTLSGDPAPAGRVRHRLGADVRRAGSARVRSARSCCRSG